MRSLLRSLLLGPAFAVCLLARAEGGTLDDAVHTYELGDFAGAFAAIQPFAEQGSAKAQALLGAMFFNGQGVPRDFGEALTWFQKAATQGDVASENQLGLMYCKGLGAPQDYAKAAQWYRIAADRDDPTAEVNLGLLYYEGQGVPQDYAQALAWYLRSAAHGNAAAEYNIGLMVAAGRGAPQDSAKAAHWWSLAAAQGSADAQNNLGAAYASGKGAPRDLVAAYKWFSLAALGYPEDDSADREQAFRNRAIVAARMTPAQLDAAKHLVSTWSATTSPTSAQVASAAPPTRSLASPPRPSPARALPARREITVQIGSYASEAAAQRRLRDAAPLPEGARAEVSATTGAAARFYRVLVTGFANPEAAAAFCAARGFAAAACWIY
jgi:hypothetical protein